MLSIAIVLIYIVGVSISLRPCCLPMQFEADVRTSSVSHDTKVKSPSVMKMSIDYEKKMYLIKVDTPLGEVNVLVDFDGIAYAYNDEECISEHIFKEELHSWTNRCVICHNSTFIESESLVSHGNRVIHDIYSIGYSMFPEINQHKYNTLTVTRTPHGTILPVKMSATFDNNDIVHEFVNVKTKINKYALNIPTSCHNIILKNKRIKRDMTSFLKLSKPIIEAIISVVFFTMISTRIRNKIFRRRNLTVSRSVIKNIHSDKLEITKLQMPKWGNIHDRIPIPESNRRHDVGLKKHIKLEKLDIDMETYKIQREHKYNGEKSLKEIMNDLDMTLIVSYISDLLNNSNYTLQTVL